ncbi:MAG: hypothetical protein JWP75_3003 [Frondihabitans sp.]|nr:hypothetical protein [Frondihabitans sp.]
MPHIVYAGQKIEITPEQLVDLKDKLREAAASGRSLDIDLLDSEGQATWLFWTPGAPIVINDGEIPPTAQFPFPDLAALGLPGLPGFPEEPPAPRRVGF